MKSYFIIFNLFLSSIANSQVLYILKDTPAPYDGYIFTIPAELQNRKLLLELDYYKSTEPLYKSNIELLTKQTDIWRKQSEELSLTLTKREDRSFWINTLYFTAGCLITTLITYSVNHK